MASAQQAKAPPSQGTSPPRPVVEHENLKACPFCAEPVRTEAIKCKHCGSAIPARAYPKTGATVSRTSAATVGCLAIIVLAATGVIFGEKPPSSEGSQTISSGAPGGSDAATTASTAAAALSSLTSPNLTAAQRNAVRSANSYLKLSGFSRLGLINQLSSEYGDRFSIGDATVAVDSLGVDWRTQAARSAASYLKTSGFSCQGLVTQLSSEYGDKYTVEQATYGATRAGIC